MGGDLPLSEVYILGVFSINVQGLGLAGKIEDNTAEHSTQFWRGNRNALRIRHCTQRVPWKQRGEEIERCLGLFCTNGRNPALRTIGVSKTKRWGD